MDASRQCPDCGTTLPENALNENCPRCLFDAALMESSAGQSPQNPTAPGDVICASAQLAVRKNIGDGGMGVVFEAHDAALGRSVAVKLMRPEHRARGQAERFLREAKILGQLEHPNIVPIHALGSDDAGEPFYAMKLVQGATLNEALDKVRRGDTETTRRFPLSELLTVFQKICDAVAFAHSKRIIHRDLKPENIMIGEYGEVLVMDWGIAKILREESDDTESDSRPASGDVRFTMQGAVIGTPTSMAPEQAGGRVMEHDERTDIFALGGILYQILTLRPAVTGTTVEEILANVMRGYIPPPVLFNQRQRLLADETPVRLAHCPNEKIPAALSAVAMKAMSVQPADRYQSVAELQHDITAYQSGFATAAERAGPLKQFALFVRRHKALAITSVAAVLAATGFMVKIIASERRANHTLAELRKAIPLMRGEVDSLIQQRKFEEALAKLDYLTSLAPKEPEFHWLRGNMLQSLLRIGDAKAAYATALSADGKFDRAREALEVCEALLMRWPGELRLDDETVKLLHELMSRQERLPEAVVFLTKYKGADRQALFLDYQNRLRAAGFRTAASNLKQFNDRTLDVDLTNAGVTNTAFLKGLPISRLLLAGEKNRINEIEGLRGMPLKSLNLNTAAQVEDWSPLIGVKLTNFWCYQLKQLPPLDYSELIELHAAGGSRLEEIGPLANAPLIYLDIGATKISNLAPIRGSKLEYLDASATGVRDLSPLSGQPLRHLSLQNTPVTNLAPLRGLAITNLDLFNTKVLDLSPLRDMPLKTLNLQATRVATLEPLRKAPLDRLVITGSKVTDLSPLRESPLKHLDALDCAISDLKPLKGLQLRYLNLYGNAKLTDLAPLAGMPLTWLDVYQAKIADIRPLREMKLEGLNLGATGVNDLDPLRGMTTLTILNLGSTPVSDIRPLRGLLLRSLRLDSTDIADIQVVRNMPLRTLHLDGCKYLKDVSPLLSCDRLEYLTVPLGATNVALLRSLPRLQRLSYKTSDAGWDKVSTPEQFWEAFPAKR